MPKKLTAASAIAAVADRSKVPLPNAAGMAELEEIFRHNDAQIDRLKRVSAHVAIEILQSHGWTGRTPQTLDRLCADHFGRVNYAWPKTKTQKAEKE